MDVAMNVAEAVEPMKSRVQGTCAWASWVLQLIVAGVLFQTLFFKFTGAEESVYIFTKLGMEPWGRVASGIVELLAVLMLLTPQTAVWGGALSLVIIGGAIICHLTKLGIDVLGDGGLLFALAVVVFLASFGILVLRRQEWMPLVRHG